MKKAFFLIAALAAFVSCVQEQTEQANETVSQEGITVFRAYTEPETKTGLAGPQQKQIYWLQGDKISLFCGSDNDNHMLESNVVQSSPVADFTTQMTGLTPDFIAIYPYSADYTREGDAVWVTVPTSQSPQAGNFDPAAFVSMAKSSNQELRFYNLCGGFRIRFTQEGITSLLIKSINGESLSGYVKVAFDSDNHPHVVTDYGNDKIFVTPVSDDGCFATGCDYFVAALPGVLASGVTFEFYVAGDIKLGESSFGGSREIKRSVFAFPRDFDAGVELVCPVPDKVDLGLSVQWASFNLGASESSEYGYYFAWGEIIPKEEYTWNRYKWGTSTNLTKYNADGSVLEPVDDPATAYLGESWRIPTSAEFRELIDACNWAFQMVGSSRVLVGTSKTDPSKSITLPLSGWIPGSNLSHAGNTGRVSLWALDVYDASHEQAHEFLCNYSGSPSPSVYQVERCNGLAVRPVYSVSTSVSMVKLDKTEASVYEGATVQLNVEVIPSTAVNQTVIWTSSNDNIATVDADGLVHGKSEGTATIYATSEDGGKQASCVVTVKGYPSPSQVDLGLSVRWSSFNLGAAKPTECGACFAWGEIVPDDDFFSYSYLWKDGYRSGETTLRAEDDAALQHLGGYWRMPTYEEMKELVNNCTWTTGYVDGVLGRTVKSNKPGFTDVSIFIPASGYIDGVDYKDQSFPYLWSSDKYNDSQARILKSEIPTVANAYLGMPVRPVYCDPSVVGSISLNKTQEVITVAQRLQLTATVLPATATDKSVTWASSDDRVAIVMGDSGLVIGVAPGKTIITATTNDGQRKATCEVTVQALDIAFVMHNPVYWFSDIESSTPNTIRCYPRVPMSYIPGSAGNDDVTIYSRNLDDNWVEFMVKIKFNGSVVTDGSIKYKYVFSNDQPSYDGKKLTPSGDKQTLTYRGEELATLTPGGQITYVWHDSPDNPAMVLLNKWNSLSWDVNEMLYCNVDLVAYSEAAEYGGYAELYKERIHVRFLRPINIDFTAKSTFQDGVPSGSTMYLGDLFSATDWNAVEYAQGYPLFAWDNNAACYQTCYYPSASHPQVYWYNYYGISKLYIDTAGITTDQSGSWSSASPAVRFWVAPAGNTMDSLPPSDAVSISNAKDLSDYVFVYASNSSSIGSYHYRVPVRVEYAWGAISGVVEIAVGGGSDPGK